MIISGASRSIPPILFNFFMILFLSGKSWPIESAKSCLAVKRQITANLTAVLVKISIGSGQLNAQKLGEKQLLRSILEAKVKL